MQVFWTQNLRLQIFKLNLTNSINKDYNKKNVNQIKLYCAVLETDLVLLQKHYSRFTTIKSS